MRVSTVFCFSFGVLIAVASFAQTATQAAAQAAPTPRRPAAAPAPAPPSRSGVAITVTDTRGLPIPGIRVTIAGPSDRNGETDDSGQVNFVALQPPLPPAAPPVEKPVAVVGHPGTPQILSIVDLAEKQLSGNAPRRETVVACSGNTRTMLVVLNQDQPERLYEGAETEYYVVAGQGAVRLNGRDTALAAGSYISLPRNTSHSIIRRGNRPLILLATLSGEPCEQAK